MSLAASSFLGSAKSRLLPPSIPLRFFGAAAVFHVALWIILLLGADGVTGFGGGPGPVLAAIHLLTLGVLTMSAMGAAFQLLPVATKQALRATWPARAASWLFIPGTAVLAGGMAHALPLVMSIGGVLVGLGILVYAAVLADNLWRTKGMVVVTGHAWGAVVALLALAGLALALIFDYEHGYLDDPLAIGAAHMILAGYGFMGLLAMGFSHILVPMFALSPVPKTQHGVATLGLSAGGVVLATAATLTGGDRVLFTAAILTGLAGAAGYVWTMADVLRRRMRKRLGTAFILIRVSWSFLPLSIAAGVVLAFGLLPDKAPALFGFAMLFGWLLTFVMGILQRITPFLASMHAAKPNRAPPLVSALTPEQPAKVHAYCHLGALALLLIGIVLDEAWIIRAGALTGLFGAGAFALFFGGVLWRLHNLRKEAAE